MFTATKKAIGDTSLMLPCTAQTLLHFQTLRKFTDLLKFIYADHNR